MAKYGSTVLDQAWNAWIGRSNSAVVMQSKLCKSKPSGLWFCWGRYPHHSLKMSEVVAHVHHVYSFFRFQIWCRPLQLCSAWMRAEVETEKKETRTFSQQTSAVQEEAGNARAGNRS